MHNLLTWVPLNIFCQYIIDITCDITFVFYQNIRKIVILIISPNSPSPEVSSTLDYALKIRALFQISRSMLEAPQSILPVTTPHHIFLPKFEDPLVSKLGQWA